jgi:RNA polymerase sigma-70 factor (ECF subfamily)
MESDESLFESVRRGDMAAFDRLYERHEVKLFAYLRALIRDRHEAEEVFHDAFLNAMRGAPREIDEGGFRPYLYRVARNAALNRLRAASRRERAHGAAPAVIERDVSPAADEELAARELEAALGRAVSRLPAPLGELYHLRASGMSYEQIAGVLEAPLGTVKSRMHQLVHALREELRPWIAPE